MDKEKKEAYRRKIEAQLEEWNAEFDVLKARAKKAGAESQMKFDQQIEELKKRRENVRERLKELQKSSDEAWHKMRDGIDKAVAELKSAWDKAKERF
ncbi:hypothetical protein SAMN05660860_00300 [Geoalkalibacter ferrihydriticus]|uniref:Coiled coil domain-containing protein n=2 Tax=Geoalkalibacter ferrihydriticus TaxID=392333 RepID=A0A0C2HS34_9BACT|nr:hypothetical protein [Geoalkalibacter ferrihydriticus]KIH75577.1 hypothetical protein GFER_15645 [Geoalkalibacter ferrihydriticus DSM 17813]SDL31119.1 hypothetical protein SAMN05660860_00300 [Geoalkalibacter ferrihydriticus]